MSEVFEYSFKKYVINLQNFEKYLITLLPVNSDVNLLYTTHSGLDDTLTVAFSREFSAAEQQTLTTRVNNYINDIPVTLSDLNKYFNSTNHSDFKVPTAYVRLILNKNNYIDVDSFELTPDKSGVKILNSGKYLIFGSVSISGDGEAIVDYSSQGQIQETKIYNKGQFYTLLDLQDNSTRDGVNVVSIYVKSSSGGVVKANTSSLTIIKIRVDGVYDNSKYFNGVVTESESIPPISSIDFTTIKFDNLKFVDPQYIYYSETGEIKLLESGKYLVTAKISTTRLSALVLLVNGKQNCMSHSDTGLITVINLPEINGILKLQATSIEIAEEGECLLKESCLVISKLQSLVTLEPDRKSQETVKYYSTYETVQRLIDTTYFWSLPLNSMVNVVDSYYTQLPEEDSIRINHPGIYVVQYQLITQAEDLVMCLNLNDNSVFVSQSNVINTCLQLYKDDIISIQLMSNTLESIITDGSSLTLMCLDNQTASISYNTYVFSNRYDDKIVVTGDSFNVKCEARPPILESGRYKIECVADFMMIAEGKEFEVKLEIGNKVSYQRVLKSRNPANATTVIISQDLDLFESEISLIRLSFRVLNFIDECVCADTLISITRINLRV